MAWAGGGRRQGAVQGFISVRLQPTMPTSPQSGNANLSGNITAGQFQGDGSLVTNLDLGNVGLGLLAPTFGGTGLDTSATPTGSLLYTSGAGTWGTLAPGGTNQILTMAGGVPTWANASGGLVLPY